MFSFLSFSQNISAIGAVAFVILAQLPLTIVAANMWYTLMIVCLTLLITDLMFSDQKQFVYEPDYENWKSRCDTLEQ